jgi:hypothetical protein
VRHDPEDWFKPRTRAISVQSPEGDSASSRAGAREGSCIAIRAPFPARPWDLMSRGPTRPGLGGSVLEALGDRLAEPRPQSRIRLAAGPGVRVETGLGVLVSRRCSAWLLFRGRSHGLAPG